MKKIISLLFLLLCSFSAQSQGRNAVVKLLNNYVVYSNANITALSMSINSLDRYNSLYDGYLRKNRELGGEEYEKPKPSPFLDADVFTMNEDNPDHLYAVALKESSGLPAAVKTDLNTSMKGIRDCSQRIVQLIDSMSNTFSGPMIAVVKNPDALPYRLLYEANRQLLLSEKYRNQLFASINSFYDKSAPLQAPKGDYIHSVDSFAKGVALCQNMLSDLHKNDGTHIAQNVLALDSLCSQLERNELVLLKGIKPYGNSKHFPNKNYYDGFDLYTKYEDMVQNLRNFSETGKRFMKESPEKSYRAGKCYAYHKECLSIFNGTLGLLYNYNEYVLLIGGGKMKIQLVGAGMSGSKYKGWGDETHSLPARSLLFWMKATPRFEVEYF